MNKEAAVIIGAVMAVLTLLNIVVTPEDAEALEALVNLFILGGGVSFIRNMVASRKSVEDVNKDVADKVFGTN